MLALALAIVAALFAVLWVLADRRAWVTVRESRLAANAHAAIYHRRVVELERMVDELRSKQLDLEPPAVRAAQLATPTPAETPTIPDRLLRELNAIEGDADRAEYRETIERLLAGGTSPDEVHARLFEG